MRRKYIGKKIEKHEKYLIIVSAVFLIATLVGCYFNKIWPSYYELTFNNISDIISYYTGDISVSEVVFTNLKTDIAFMSSISIFTLFVVTFPISVIIFILKGFSIGYTINSCIIGYKLESIKIIILTLFKNIIIIPAMIILVLVSLSYINDMRALYRKKNKDQMMFASKRYALNSLLIISIAIIIQVIINIISTAILQFLVR